MDALLNEPEPAPPGADEPQPKGPDAIRVHSANTHNLKSVSCRFPHRALTVVTGVSGSGKSSLAFDTLYAEGQRRYIQTFSTYAQQFLERIKKPAVEAIRNLPPAVALRQHNAISQPRSTIGTLTEIHDYLGLLYTALGEVLCPWCDVAVVPQTPHTIADVLLDQHSGTRAVFTAQVAVWKGDAEGHRAELLRDGFGRIIVSDAVIRLEEATAAHLAMDHWSLLVDRVQLGERTTRLLEAIEQGLAIGQGGLDVWFPDEAERRRFFRDWRCDQCERAFHQPSPQLFSFNTPLGACGKCSGFGRAMGLDRRRVVPNPRRSLAGGAVAPYQTDRGAGVQRAMELFATRAGIPLDCSWSHLTADQREAIFRGDELYTGVVGFFKALDDDRFSPASASILAKFRSYTECDACDGSRLSLAARAVHIAGHQLGELTHLALDDLAPRVATLVPEGSHDGVHDVLSAITTRARTLCRLGLHYLTLGRMTRTLSSGEYHRARLATCLNRGLVDTCYVLDEPTAGLHDADGARLVEVVQELVALGNTVVVVEHDERVIRAADHVIELGPVGGQDGGRLLCEGPVAAVLASDTPTGTALGRRAEARVRRDPGGRLTVRGASLHNLQDVTASLPTGCLTAVTGVSGSGKSTLVFDVLEKAVRPLIERGQRPSQTLCDEVSGAQAFDQVIAMGHGGSQATARSTVLTRSGALDVLRKTFAETRQSLEKGLTPMHFSTNVRGGRCEACQGLGVQRIDMHFMGDLEVPCEVCEGRRFSPRVLEVRLAGKSIHHVHQMTVQEAVDVFSSTQGLVDALQPVCEVGLGYLRLGQSVRTLSGGEAQRLRIAEHLAASARKPTRTALFLFDEPTVGLHRTDTDLLIGLLHRLCDQGHTCVVVEHNLQLIAAADWVIDMGPEGGAGGGQIVAEGPPETIGSCPQSQTGAALRLAGLLKAQDSC